jgi:3-hydroxybutyrate dehydrogenase
MKKLENKNIIVTAAGQGIGRATAIAYSKEGANVIATDINEKTLKSLSNEFPNIKVNILDSTKNNDIKDFFSKIDKVDVLFNAVGYVMIKEILPKMIKQNKGNIINMSSIASSLRGLPNRFVYGTTKAAIVGLTKSIAADFIKNNIRCNVIAPGTVHTPSWEERVAAAPDPAKAKKDFIARQPMGRLGRADEIAALAVYLASNESDFVTGVVHSIDGGMSI